MSFWKLARVNVMRNIFHQTGKRFVETGLKPKLFKEKRSVKVLMFCNKENGLTKQVKLSLLKNGTDVKVREVDSEKDMIELSEIVDHDMVICPYLTKRIPNKVLENREKPCLIVHPGIVGDRGMSSLDWAILEKQKYWGVSVLQAEEEMDSGDVWSTREFPVPKNTTKSDLYNGEVTSNAVEAVLEAVARFKLGILPKPLDPSSPETKGILKSRMRARDRIIDWQMPCEDIVRKIRMSDSQPGCRARLNNLDMKEAVVFGGHVQHRHQSSEIRALLDEASVGDVTAQKHGAVLIKSADGNGVWCTHMKHRPGRDSIKLPATSVLGSEVEQFPTITGPSSWEEITTSYLNGDRRIALIHFDFYNGAMSIDQCHRLQKEIEKVAKDSTVKTVVLLGGGTFFSNGIHLNTIEAADDPARESWLNINAIDDLILSFVSMKDKVTIAALQGGAGAGGVMMAAAADVVWARKGILLTPTYKAMHLYGSEYWTYFLPKRVGTDTAQKLTSDTQSLLSEKAESIGLVDKTFGRDPEEFLRLLTASTRHIFEGSLWETMINYKSQVSLEELKMHRAAELEKMKECFQSKEYEDARKAFVYH